MPKKHQWFGRLVQGFTGRFGMLEGWEYEQPSELHGTERFLIFRVLKPSTVVEEADTARDLVDILVAADYVQRDAILAALVTKREDRISAIVTRHNRGLSDSDDDELIDPHL